MIEAMNTITNGNGYPIFMPNQVLKNRDLNNIISYLDSQNRLTRTHLIGMGIICGLEVKLSPALDKIEITSGCGLTSEGFVIPYSTEGTNQDSFTHYRNETLPQNLLLSGAAVADDFLLQELILASVADAAPAEDILPLTELDDLEQKIVLLVYDWQDDPRDSCLIDCDDLGQDRNFRLRFFLINQEIPGSVTEENAEVLSAERLLREGFDLQPEQSLTAAFQGWFDVPDCHIDRIGYTVREGEEVVDLSTMTDFDALRAAYYSVCRDGILSLDQALRRTHQLFGFFSSSFEPDSSIFDDLKDRLKKILIALVSVEIANQNPFPGDIPPYTSTQTQVGYGVQYFYDYLVELIVAFNELKATIFELMDDCPPDRERFPRYLLLGEVEPTPEDCPRPSLFRHQFYQPPIYNGNQRRKQEIRHLYERLVRLTQHFTLLPFYQTPIKVTPSRNRQATLGEQAIPYYYWYPQLYPYWNYDACRKQQATQLSAYFHLNGIPNQDRRGYDLIPRIDQSDFFRIEGHLGRTLDEAREKIQGFKDDFNLAFDLVAVRLGPEDVEGNLVLNGYFDDLELEFDQLKADWEKKKKKVLTNIRDAYLNQILGLMEDNFLGKADLSQIDPRLMENEFLKLAQDQTNYEFIGEGSDRFLLFLNQRETRVGFVPTDELNSPYLFELTGEQTAENQSRIIETFATCFSVRRVTFEIRLDNIVDREPVNLVNRLDPRVYRFSIRDGRENIELLGDETQDLTDFAIAIEDETPYSARTLIQRYDDWDALYAFAQFFAARSERDIERELPEHIPYYEFRALIQRYLYRLETIKQLQSFPEYARQHRGLEHLGGVPKGGTFVLVYLGDSEQINELITRDLSLISLSDTQIEALTETQTQLPPGPSFSGSNRNNAINSQRRERNVVVADFCLPYQCCSPYGNINYVMARPKPFIGLSQSVFCENDDTIYKFILEPIGGLLKGGDGIVDFEGQYAFQPNQVDADITEPTNLTFFYIVDGVGSSFSVLLLPVADASFSVHKGSSPFCVIPGQSQNIIFAIAMPGGTIYQSLDGGTPQVVAVVEKGKFYSYDLSEILFPESRNSIKVSFTYIISSTDDYCGARSKPVEIAVTRAPRLKIAYPQNAAGQATGTIVHNPDNCADLRLKVDFKNAFDDIADKYRWQLFGQDVATTANTTLELIYDGKPKQMTLIAANSIPGSERECINSINESVSLMPLDPRWRFENTQLQVIDNDGIKIIILRKIENQTTPPETILVNQAGGRFSENGGMKIVLNDNTLPCENQTKYTLDYSGANPGTYKIIYSLPDDSSFSRIVRIEFIVG